MLDPNLLIFWYFEIFWVNFFIIVISCVVLLKLVLIYITKAYSELLFTFTGWLAWDFKHLVFYCYYHIVLLIATVLGIILLLIFFNNLIYAYFTLLGFLYDSLNG